MILAISIDDGHGLSIEARHELLPKKTKVITNYVAVYFTVRGILPIVQY